MKELRLSFQKSWEGSYLGWGRHSKGPPGQGAIKVFSRESVVRTENSRISACSSRGGRWNSQSKGPEAGLTHSRNQKAVTRG